MQCHVQFMHTILFLWMYNIIIIITAGMLSVIVLATVILTVICAIIKIKRQKLIHDQGMFNLTIYTGSVNLINTSRH